MIPSVLFIPLVYSQTSGTLTFNCNTFAPNSNYGTKHVLAVWLENTANPSVFIKTKAKYGNEDDHLTSWVSKSGNNLVDAVTGATLLNYTLPISITWNGTNVSGTVVPDGTYNVFIEMGWGSNKTTDHAVSSFQFVKGASPQHQSLNSTTNFTNGVLDWVPVTTLSGVTENFGNVCMFPNPTSGTINILFARELQDASIMVTNESGKSLFSEHNQRIPAGLKSMDISAYRNGLYYITIQSADLHFTYKILLNR